MGKINPRKDKINSCYLQARYLRVWLSLDRKTGVNEFYKDGGFVTSGPGVNFINILCMNFSYERCCGSFFYVHVSREKLPQQRSYEKFVHKMLMKLTPEIVKKVNQ